MNTRPCPECSTTMEYRLGEFECPDCGHSEPMQQQAEEHSPSGPGLRRKQQWQGGSQAAVPPAVPPPSAYPQQPGFGFGSPDYDPAPPAPVSSALQTEKHVYFALSVLGFGSMVLLLVFTGTVLSSDMMNSELGSSPEYAGIRDFIGPFIFWIVIALLVYLVLLGVALYGTAAWVKWTCMVYTAIGILGSFVSMFVAATAGPEGALGSVLGILGAVWLILILYRDIQQTNAGYS